MIGRTRGPCAIYQAVLLDFADHRERTEATLTALDHLERCRRCEDEVAGIVRMIVGLRRLADSVARIEPDAGAWPRLRDRVTRREPRVSRLYQPLGGLMAAVLVALFVFPSIGGGASALPAGFGEPTSLTLVEDRHYESPAGALTAEMINAIAGHDISTRARLRSAVFRIAPSSVDRDEPSHRATLVGPSDGAGMPVIIARS